MPRVRFTQAEINRVVRAFKENGFTPLVDLIEGTVRAMPVDLPGNRNFHMEAANDADDDLEAWRETHGAP